MGAFYDSPFDGEDEMVAYLKAARTLSQEQVDANEREHDADAVYDPADYYTGRH